MAVSCEFGKKKPFRFRKMREFAGQAELLLAAHEGLCPIPLVHKKLLRLWYALV